MSHLNHIRQIEERALNAWPGLRSVLYDGWLLRFADGYTRRANSVNFLYPSALDLNEKIDYCERLYSAQGLNTVFKLTDAAPIGLEALLDQRGYGVEVMSSVQTMPLDDLPTVALPMLTVTVEDQLTTHWQDAYQRMNDIDPRFWSAMTALLNNIALPHAFVSIHSGQTTVAAGLAVVERDYVGVFDVVVAASHRHQGVGQHLMLNLLNWGKGQGATTAYLQVLATNAPALRLYQRLGFSEMYRYWYRSKNLVPLA